MPRRTESPHEGHGPCAWACSEALCARECSRWLVLLACTIPRRPSMPRCTESGGREPETCAEACSAGAGGRQAATTWYSSRHTPRLISPAPHEGLHPPASAHGDAVTSLGRGPEGDAVEAHPAPEARLVLHLTEREARHAHVVGRDASLATALAGDDRHEVEAAHKRGVDVLDQAVELPRDGPPVLTEPCEVNPEPAVLLKRVGKADLDGRERHPALDHDGPGHGLPAVLRAGVGPVAGGKRARYAAVTREGAAQQPSERAARHPAQPEHGVRDGEGIREARVAHAVERGARERGHANAGHHLDVARVDLVADDARGEPLAVARAADHMRPSERCPGDGDAPDERGGGTAENPVGVKRGEPADDAEGALRGLERAPVGPARVDPGDWGYDAVLVRGPAPPDAPHERGAVRPRRRNKA